MDITTFSTLDVREQGRKSYVASYRVNEELVILRMFSRELRQCRRFAKDFFHKRFPIYGVWMIIIVISHLHQPKLVHEESYIEEEYQIWLVNSQHNQSICSCMYMHAYIHTCITYRHYTYRNAYITIEYFHMKLVKYLSSKVNDELF